MKKLKDGKTLNITIRVTEELRKKAEKLWEKDYFAMPFNAFLGYLVDKGAEEEEFISRYRDKRAEMKNRGDNRAQAEAEADNTSVINGIVKKNVAGN